MSTQPMTRLERKTVLSLSSVMALRMLGLFMVLPLFSLYAQQLRGATPAGIGIATGIYGLTQGLLQLPLGWLSDRIGRKPVIITGLGLFIVGSLIAALAHTLSVLTLGRALQGAGAIGATIMATLADATRESQRSKAMAINGITIGISFSIAMALGPFLHQWLSVGGLFWVAATAGCAALGIVFTMETAPERTHLTPHATLSYPTVLSIMRNLDLMRLNISVFLLHAIFTASFVVIPIGLASFASLASAQQWQVYIPALLMAFTLTLPSIRYAEKKHRVKTFFVGSILCLLFAEILLGFFIKNILISTLSLLLFFYAFSVLEAFLPSLVSRFAPPTRKGTALGLYSSSQFLGIFIGGSLAGWLYGRFGLTNVYLICVTLATLWFILALTMNKPPAISSAATAQSSTL